VAETLEVVRGSVVVNYSTSKDIPTAAAEGAKVGETQFSVVKQDRSAAERQHSGVFSWPAGENVEDFIAAATEGRYEVDEDESDS
jgi:hypothetical protein